jgi:hypothetical protein
LRTGKWVCGMAPWREPYELRGSRTVLREPWGETPWGYSPRDRVPPKGGGGTSTDGKDDGKAETGSKPPIN